MKTKKKKTDFDRALSVYRRYCARKGMVPGAPVEAKSGWDGLYYVLRGGRGGGELMRLCVDCRGALRIEPRFARIVEIVHQCSVDL
ncbi:MAG: hypothetical protein KF764_31545 [Labilithrix sp.]|nr:hypothetical protein [Labilithrix sp.]